MGETGKGSPDSLEDIPLERLPQEPKPGKTLDETQEEWVERYREKHGGGSGPFVLRPEKPRDRDLFPPPMPPAEHSSESETVANPTSNETEPAQRKNLITWLTSMAKGAVGVVKGAPRAVGGFAKDTTKDTAANIASGKGPGTLNPLGHPSGFIRQEPPSTNQTQSSKPSQS